MIPRISIKESPKALTVGNGKAVSFGIGPLYWVSFSYNSLAWYFSSCWFHLEANKVILLIKRIKVTLPLAPIPAWMSCIYECNPDTEKVEARKNKNHWERKWGEKAKLEWEQYLWLCYKICYWNIWTIVKKICQINLWGTNRH